MQESRNSFESKSLVMDDVAEASIGKGALQVDTILTKELCQDGQYRSANDM